MVTTCSNNSDDVEMLEEITIDIIQWEYTSDTGNNSSRLRYEIQFTNPNDADINGFHRIKQNNDGLEITQLSTNFSPCYLIEANSSCTLSFDEESSHDLGIVNSITLISVEYNIVND